MAAVNVAVQPWVLTQQDGRLVLQRATDHESVAGVVLGPPSGSGRPLPFRERVRVVTGARRAISVHTSAGPVELAATDDVLAWLRDRLTAG